MRLKNIKNYGNVYWTNKIWSGPIDTKFGVTVVRIQTNAMSQCPYKLKAIFWTKFLTPERPQFCGQFQITSIVIKNHCIKSESVISDKLYQSMSSYKSKTKFLTKFRPINGHESARWQKFLKWPKIPEILENCLKTARKLKNL